MSFIDTKNEEGKFSSAQIKKGQMYLNIGKGADDVVSADLLNYIASQAGADTTASANDNFDTSKVASNVIADGGESGDGEGDFNYSLGQSTMADDGEDDSEYLTDTTYDAAKEIGGKTFASDASAGKRIGKQADKRTDKGKSGVAKAIKSADRRRNLKDFGKKLDRGKELGGTGLDIYSAGMGFDDKDYEVEGVESIAPTAQLTSTVSGLTSKGLDWGSSLAKDAGKAGKLSSAGTKAGNVAGIAGAVSGGASLVSDIISLGDIGSKGQTDEEIASQALQTTASGLSFGVGMAAAGVGAGTGAFGATATAVATGASAFGPIGWAVAGLTILSMGLADLF